MDYGRRNTKKYNFRCPDLKELRKLSSFVLDPLDFKQCHGKLLSVLSADLVPTLEEYAHLLGIAVSDKVSFSGLEEIPRSHIIAEALHLKKSEIEAHWVKKGGMFGLTSEFLIGKANAFALAGSMDAFEAIFVLLIYGLALFPNIDGFVDVNAIRIFLVGNLVPTLLGNMYFSLHLRNSKGGETILEGLLYQEGKDPQLLKQKMVHAWHNVHRKGRSELGPCNCVAWEAYTLWVKKRALELKMLYACERPMSMVVVEPLALPNQDVEELFFFRQISYWLFFCASAKLTHRYNTHANHLRIMEHLEQENRELKDEITHLTAMMESVLAAESQSSPTLATPPPQRTVIS
ncbi:hypothetical protein KIW84_051098 [Lathyrus oleraceus]|uniref:DUF7745 domain-containing protein n=1 Tax=Pisum sativum TaxID=3888 RepID=A0A9D4WJ95_PEA|nr:hypothetical protein KIW84_051098 [Pisum sativum]